MPSSFKLEAALREKPRPVTTPGEFAFAAAYLDHDHLFGQCQGLIEAGARLKWVFDPRSEKADALLRKFPGSRRANSFEQVLDDPEVRLIAAAAVPCDRGPLGCRVMRAGKDYFTDKTPFTSLEHLEEARRVAAETKRIYAVYYSERLHSEAAMFATQLIADGVIGRVVQVLGLGPHRLNKPTRPDWFFKRAKYGGILCDIGSHQIEQFLTFSGARDARVVHACVRNVANPESPEVQDYGEASLIGDNGATHFMRVDWLTPAGLSTWGDGRVTVLGTTGYLELRKYVDIARDRSADHVYLVDSTGEHHLNVARKIGYSYFGHLISDSLHRTETAMAQSHTFKAAELALRAQAFAEGSLSAQSALP